MADESSVKLLFAKVKAKFGKAHVLVNGAATMSLGPIGDISVGSWWSDYVRSLLSDDRTELGGIASNQLRINRKLM